MSTSQPPVQSFGTQCGGHLEDFIKNSISNTLNNTPINQTEIPQSTLSYTMGKTQLRPFSGEADVYRCIEDLAAWLEHYKDICIMNRWMTDVEKIRNVSIALVGEADIYYSLNKV